MPTVSLPANPSVVSFHFALRLPVLRFFGRTNPSLVLNRAATVPPLGRHQEGRGRFQGGWKRAHVPRKALPAEGEQRPDFQLRRGGLPVEPEIRAAPGEPPGRPLVQPAPEVLLGGRQCEGWQ